MNTIIFRLLGFVFVVVFAFTVTPSAFAHGDEPRLEINAEKINPGGVVEVRGVDFEFEEVVLLSLIGAGVEIPLGDITSDAEGQFLQIVSMPGDLPEGGYQFQAVTDDHEITSPRILVQGVPIEEVNEGQRDEEESLLAPMPTFAPGVSPTLPVQAVSSKEAQTKPDQFAIIIPVLTTAGALLLLGIARMKKRSND